MNVGKVDSWELLGLKESLSNKGVCISFPQPMLSFWDISSADGLLEKLFANKELYGSFSTIEFNG